MLLNHLPIAFFFDEDNRHAGWNFRAVRQPELWTIGDPADITRGIGLRIAIDNADSADLL